MQSKLTIPDRIKAGFQNRKDTYTGRLGFVISMGRNGKKARKEDPKSWVGWRDNKIAPEEYDNEPTEGFVLNRDVGGTQRSYDWNARREKIRVYDPRNFEIEISVENVLLILQECSSIKGKGLEGEFVYAWSGGQIVLLPVGCPEYNTAKELINLGDQKVTKADMVEGCTYLTKDKENLMYMGRHPWFNIADKYGYYYNKKLTGQKKHIFVRVDGGEDRWGNKYKGKDIYVVESGFTKLATRTSDSPIPQYADAYTKLMRTSMISQPTSLITKPTKNEKMFSGYGYRDSICIEEGDKILCGKVIENEEHGRGRYSYNRDDSTRRWDIELTKVVYVKDGGFVESSCRDHGVSKKALTKQEVKAVARDLFVKCENGSEYQV